MSLGDDPLPWTLPNLADVTHPLNDLLKCDTVWTWDTVQAGLQRGKEAHVRGSSPSLL